MSTYNITTIARWALVLFVMAWLNLVIQAPVHAAMKQDKLSHPCCQDDMSLCDLVLSIEAQADEAMGSTTLDPLDFQVVSVFVTQPQSVVHIAPNPVQRRWLRVRQYAPPPLLLKTTLQI